MTKSDEKKSCDIEGERELRETVEKREKNEIQTVKNVQLHSNQSEPEKVANKL